MTATCVATGNGNLPSMVAEAAGDNRSVGDAVMPGCGAPLSSGMNLDRKPSLNAHTDMRDGLYLLGCHRNKIKAATSLAEN